MPLPSGGSIVPWWLDDTSVEGRDQLHCSGGVFRRTQRSSRVYRQSGLTKSAVNFAPPPPPPPSRGFLSLLGKAVSALNLALEGDKAFARATGGAMESKFFLNRYRTYP